LPAWCGTTTQVYAILENTCLARHEAIHPPLESWGILAVFL